VDDPEESHGAGDHQSIQGETLRNQETAEPDQEAANCGISKPQSAAEVVLVPIFSPYSGIKPSPIPPSELSEQEPSPEPADQWGHRKPSQ